MQHTSALVVDNALQVVRETCFPCVLDGHDPEEPCRQARTTAADLTTGALVQTRRTLRWDAVPARTAVVLSAVGQATDTMAVLWFWQLGAPVWKTTLFTAHAADIAPMNTTLTTLPQTAYRTLAAAHIRARRAGGLGARAVKALTIPLAYATH
jgi:Family of unknown function (DUF6409)